MYVDLWRLVRDAECALGVDGAGKLGGAMSEQYLCLCPNDRTAKHDNCQLVGALSPVKHTGLYQGKKHGNLNNNSIADKWPTAALPEDAADVETESRSTDDAILLMSP